MSAQDAERRRIERDIHDGVQQQLVALCAKLELARHQLARDPALAEGTLLETQRDARHAVEDLREFTRGIHPPVLADRGLVAALEARASVLPIGVTFIVPPDVRRTRYGDEIESAAYFIVSEALTNTLKHARAATATVTITGSNGSLAIEVTDDGVGFDYAAAGRSGLTGLEDRADALGGTFDVTGGAAGGTTVRASLPLAGSGADA